MTQTSKANFSASNLTIKVIAGLLISTASLYMFSASAAPIYKVVDEKTGQVTFTDNPQSYEQQIGKQISQTNITTGNDTTGKATNNSNSNNRTSNSNNTANATSTSTSNGSTLNTQSVTALPEMAAAAVQTSYQLVMIEPSEERAYRRPAQNIVVQLQIKPALQVGDSVIIYIDDTVVAQGLSASIATVDILPGEHVVRAVVMNKQGQVVQQVLRTVYVIQNTARIQENKRIAEQLLAYQRLPWHQKVLLKMRQDNKRPNMQSFNKPLADTPMTLEIPAIK